MMIRISYVARTANNYGSYLMEIDEGLSKPEIEALEYINKYFKIGEELDIKYKKNYKEAYKKGTITKLIKKDYLYYDKELGGYVFDPFGEAWNVMNRYYVNKKRLETLPEVGKYIRSGYSMADTFDDDAKLVDEGTLNFYLENGLVEKVDEYRYVVVGPNR